MKKNLPPRTPEMQAQIDAWKKSIGPALAARLNYNVMLQEAGSDPSKWTPEQATTIEALRAELVATSRPADEDPRST